MIGDWKKCKITDIAEFMGDAPFGTSIKNHDYTESGALVVQGKNISGCICNWSDRRYVSIEKYNSLPKSHCSLGDLIFPKVGTIGKVGFLTPFGSQKRYILSTNTMCLRPNEKIACSKYVYYYFASSKVSKLIQSLNANSVQPVFNFTALKDFEILLPPLPEQHAIAHILGSLDDKVELNRQMNETLEGIARALFKSWFVDFDPVRAKMEGREPYGMGAQTAALFPDGFEDSALGEIPKGWKIATIGDATHVVGGSTPSTKESAYWDEGTIHWVTPKDLSSLPNAVLIETERCITESGLRQISSGLLPKGTVLLSSRAPIGYLAITAIPVAINQGFIALICEKELSNHYILQWLHFNMDVIKGHANGTTFLEISKTSFRPLPLIVPSHPILEIFNQQASNVHEMLVSNLEQNQTLTALRDTLLPKLLSGEIRVNDAEKAVEAAV